MSYQNIELNDIGEQLRCGLNSVNIKQLERLHRKEQDPNKKIIYGAGFFSKLKDLGVKAFKKVKDMFPKSTKELFQHAANSYRKLYGKNTTRMLYPGEFHYGLHNYTGPGTRIDLPNVRNAIPYNNIDNASRTHDIEYMEAMQNPDPVQRALLVQAADQKAINEYNKYPNENGYRAAVNGILSKWRLEQLYSAIQGKPSTIYGGIQNTLNDYQSVYGGRKNRSNNRYIEILRQL